MVVDIHKVITGNPITKNLMKPWGSNKQKTIFNKYTGPGNDLSKQLRFNFSCFKLSYYNEYKSYLRSHHDCAGLKLAECQTILRRKHPDKCEHLKS